ncbi:MAG: family 43 glycosylhydrolase [Bifidobacterium pseudocatenulatum]
MLNPIQRISLDMTVISDSGRWYYAWQQVGSIWIASFDPARPERLTCEPKQVVVPEFAWDNMIAEGPNAIVHDGTIYLIYSGSLVGIDYTTGLVTAPAGQDADLTDPNVWTKLDYPLQKSEYTTGNGSSAPAMACGPTTRTAISSMYFTMRNTRMDGMAADAQVRRVHWSKEGMPILDMQAAEELNPDYADITMKIVVSGNKG